MHRLLERASELEQLNGLVDRLSAGLSSAAVIEGPAGIGKTRLLAEARARAVEHGATVLAARGSERERSYPFGVVRQLLQPHLLAVTERERRALFSGAAALAAPVFDPGAGGGALEHAGYATMHGLYWLLAAITEQDPVLVVVDDMHWADEPSARFLEFLERRLDGLAIALVIAARPREPTGEDGLAADLVMNPVTEVIQPAPLSQSAVATLVSESLGAETDAPFAHACWKATSGNPFFLSALLGELARAGTAPIESEAARVQGLGPASVLRSILVRMAALPSGALALAQAVAVLGDEAEPAHAAALASITAAQAMDAAEALVRIGIFEEARGLTFTHPIVRAALYGDLTASRRALRHAEAAHLLTANGAPLDEVAAHLLLTAPGTGQTTAQTLRTAARLAMAQGAPEVAATYLRRALDDPHDPQGQAELLIALGAAEAHAGQPGCVAHLQTALRQAQEPGTRVDAGLGLARALGAAGRSLDSVAMLCELADGLTDSAPLLASRVELELLNVADVELPLRTMIRERRAPPQPGSEQSPAGLAHLAVEASLAGESARYASGLAVRALADGELLAGALVGGHLFFLITNLLIYAEAYAEADSFLAEALAKSVAHGSALGFIGAAAGRSHLHARMGELVEAEADAHAAAEAAKLNAWPWWLGHTRTLLARTLLDQGDAHAAAAALAWDQPAASLPLAIQETALLETRGHVRIALGETDAGVADLRESGRRFERWGLLNPAAFPWRSGAALGLSSLGRTVIAESLAASEVARARTWGSPRALGVALRAQGVVAGSSGDTELLAEAARVLASSRAPVEHARALTDLGAALRRQNQRTAARGPLREALQLAHACGALAIADRARTELAAAGARPRTPWRTGADALTPSERRIARMAASGLSNPAIAQALFVTVKTIEMHLTSTYRKLDIHSRGALSAAVLGGPELPADI